MKLEHININFLTHSISTNSRSAFNIFYQIYYDDIFRISYHFLKDKEACREVVQDIFFSIWQSRKKLHEIKNLEAYFYTIARNEALHYLSKTQKERDTLSFDEHSILLANVADSTSPETTLQDQEIQALLTQIINELPEKCRRIFLMARQDGLRTKEIAKIMGINESTVRVQMKIAIEKIVDRIRPQFPNLTLTALFALYVLN